MDGGAFKFRNKASGARFNTYAEAEKKTSAEGAEGNVDAVDDGKLIRVSPDDFPGASYGFYIVDPGADPSNSILEPGTGKRLRKATDEENAAHVAARGDTRPFKRTADVPESRPEISPFEQRRVELRGRLSSLNEARRKNWLSDAFAPALLHLPQRISATSTLSDADAKIEFGQIEEALQMLESQVTPAVDQPDAPPFPAEPRDILDDLNAPASPPESGSTGLERLKTREEQDELQEAVGIFWNAYDDRTHESRLYTTPRAFRAAATRSIRAKHGRVVEALIRVISTYGENPPTVTVLRNLYSTIDAEINSRPPEARREKTRIHEDRAEDSEAIKLLTLKQAQALFEKDPISSKQEFKDLYDDAKTRLTHRNMSDLRKWLQRQGEWLDQAIVKEVLDQDEDFKKKTGETPAKAKTPEQAAFEKDLARSLDKMFPKQG